jgi:polysaccharide export outer membrane protein
MFESPLLRPPALIMLALVVGSCGLAGCNTSGGARTATETTASAAALPPPDAPATSQAEYRIAPLDTVEISVFQVQELQRTAQVDASGQILLPLIGHVAAAGKTARELEAEIAALLGAKYLQAPQVTVAVRESPSQRITVEGSVKKPGVFPVAGQTTLLRMVAQAEGVVDTANPSNVTVFRTVNNQRMSATFDLRQIRSGKASDPEVFGGDVVVVGESGTKAALRDIGRAMPVLGIFSPLL